MNTAKGFVSSAVVSLVCSFRCIATDVLTYHNDNARTGWNPNEVMLTPANVNPNTFGLLFNLIVDGNVDAQPLYVSNAPVFSRGVFQGNQTLLLSRPNTTACMHSMRIPGFFTGNPAFWVQAKLLRNRGSAVIR